MKYWLFLAPSFLMLVIGCNPKAGNTPPSKLSSRESTNKETKVAQQAHQEPERDFAEAMRKLRQKFLTDSPADLGLKPTPAFPKVYGCIAEFPLSPGTMSVVSICDGNASLYTTSKFGVIGGFVHERVRSAAIAFVTAAQDFHDEAATTTEFPYPQPGHARCYLLTYSGVRVIDADFTTVELGKSPYFRLFDKGNDVITELRLLTEREQKP